MIEVVIDTLELWDEQKQEFVSIPKTKIQLEHSLLSLSKWESKWEKPFLSKTPHSREETIDYIRCMTLTEGIDPDIYNYIPDSVINEVNNYISSAMTATYVSDNTKKHLNGEQVTAELIYYWMLSFNIWKECEEWHLNRLITLIRVCERKNQGPEKLSQREILERNNRLNEERKRKWKTKG